MLWKCSTVFDLAKASKMFTTTWSLQRNIKSDKSARDHLWMKWALIRLVQRLWLKIITLDLKSTGGAPARRENLTTRRIPLNRVKPVDASSYIGKVRGLGSVAPGQEKLPIVKIKPDPQRITRSLPMNRTTTSGLNSHWSLIITIWIIAGTTIKNKIKTKFREFFKTRIKGWAATSAQRRKLQYSLQKTTCKQVLGTLICYQPFLETVLLTQTSQFLKMITLIASKVKIKFFCPRTTILRMKTNKTKISLEILIFLMPAK